MGIFGSTSRQILEYTIWLTDKARVAELQAADGPAGTVTTVATIFSPATPTFDPRQIQAPLKAAAEFSAPLQIPSSATFTPPIITSPYFTGGANFPLDQDSFKRKSGGWFGISAIFGNTVYFYWRRKFAFRAADGTSGAGDGGTDAGSIAVLPPTVVSNRRWVDGFELGFTAEAAVDAAQLVLSRDAARHVDGVALAQRDVQTTNGHRNHLLTKLGGAGPFTSHWDRFYIRLRKLPTAAACIYRSHSLPSSAQGMMLQIGPAGELVVNSVDNVSFVSLHGAAGVLTLDRWTRIDLLLQQAGAPSFMGRAGASFRVFVNGLAAFDVPAASGLGGTSITDTEIGHAIGLQFGLECDFDDWIGAELPTTTGNIITDPSWFAGSRVRLIRVTGIVTPGAWTLPVDGWRVQLGRFPETTPNLVQSSSVSGDTITYSTDALTSVDALPGSIGVGAMVLMLYNMASGAADGRLGYKLGAGAVVMVAHNNPITNLAWTQALYNCASANPPALGALQLLVEHSASVQLEQHAGFFAIAEVLGYWGPEDPRGSATSTIAKPIELPNMNGVHNAPFPNTGWATAAVIPPAAVAVYAGTYVGTGAPKDLTFTNPIHWLWIRPLTGNIEGARWWSSMLDVHQRYNDSPSSSLVPDVCIDPNFAPAAAVDAQELQCLVRLAGNLQTNAVGVTYQYVAFSDAAMRFCMNNAFAHRDTLVGPFDNLIWNPKWTPEAGMFWQENPIFGDTGAVPQLWYKGVGHAAAAASLLNSAETASFGEFLLGIFRSRVGAHNQANTSVAANLWRRDDKSQDPGLPRVLQLVSYVGDGSGARVINLVPLSGRRPLFCLVTPHNATPAIYRDPSHTGTTSSQINNVTNAALGITAGGIDQITVNTGLNAAGILYDVFVLPGDTVAGNAGWSANGTFIPVAPGVGGDPGGVQITDFVDFEGDNPYLSATAPDIVSDLSTDLDTVCLPRSNKIVNLALSHLGISTQIVNLGTDLTQEAATARLHYTEDAAAVLRDFPWAFATRYSDPLTLVRGPAWTGATIRAWSATESYEAGDVVKFGSTIFYALLSSLGVVPVTGLTWSSATSAAPEDSNEDWLYAYRVPANMILARRLVREGLKRGFDPNPPPFRIGQDLNGDVILTDEQDAVLEYTFRPPCVASAGDALFRDAFAWRLAHSFCPSLAKDTKKQAYCWQMYKDTLTRAAVPNANEQAAQNPRGDGDADWITGRN